MTKKLRKGAFFTDIHWGKKSNSDVHNQDCTNFIDWFCEQVTSDPTIDYVGFLGDWNETRSALNISTLNYSYYGAKKLNNLGLPVFFVVGNHDLYHRHTREIHSVLPFHEFSNFTVIDQPVIIDQIKGGALFSPYLFHEEYSKLAEYLTLPFWAGHFEFKGFVVTGHSVKMPTGPDHSNFRGPKHIISGHFHKRQEQDNIIYMGNAFPMDFGDAGDSERGMMVYDHNVQERTFINWPECPKYTKTTLSQLLDESVVLHDMSRVKVVIDVPITFEESTIIREQFTKQSALREFSMEESIDIQNALTKTESSVDETTNLEKLQLDTVDELVVQMLNDIESDHIDNALLIQQYNSLKA